MNPKHYQGCLAWHASVNNGNAWSIMICFGDENNNAPTITSLFTITGAVCGVSSIAGECLNAIKKNDMI